MRQIVAVLLLLVVQAGAAPRAKAETGVLQGIDADGISVFRGIPYAAPPVGRLRWRQPQAPAAWEGIRDAATNGHACPQPAGKYPEWADAAISAAGMREDCLTLNIWAPANARDLPVMFYIHGDNMQFGSNVMPIYNGDELARESCTLVVIDYRLGYLGRFGNTALSRLQADEPLNNCGLQEQIAARADAQGRIRRSGRPMKLSGRLPRCRFWGIMARLMTGIPDRPQA